MHQSIVFMMHMCISMNMQQTCSKSSEGSASAEASMLDHLNVKAHAVISRFCCVAFSELNRAQQKSFFKISGLLEVNPVAKRESAPSRRMKNIQADPPLPPPPTNSAWSAMLVWMHVREWQSLLTSHMAGRFFSPVNLDQQPRIQPEGMSFNETGH